MKRANTLRILHRVSGTLLLTSAVCLSGCVKGSLLTPDAPRTDGKIRISSVIEASTKAPALNSTTLQGVLFLRSDRQQVGVAPGSYDGNAPITGNRTSTGNITFDEEQSYLPNYDNVWFLAHWPAGTTASATNTEAVWGIDGKTDILVSNEYNAGTYINPLNGTGGTNGSPMTFHHCLAQLEVVCKADPDATIAGTQQMWGNITGIELLETPPVAELVYSDLSMHFTSGTPEAKPLLQNDYQTDFATIAIPASTNTTVNAAGMFAPSTGALKLRVTTEKIGAVTLTVRLQQAGTEMDFEAGLKHTVNLTFKAKEAAIEVFSTEIAPWGTGNTAGDTEVEKSLAPTTSTVPVASVK